MPMYVANDPSMRQLGSFTTAAPANRCRGRRYFEMSSGLLICRADTSAHQNEKKNDQSFAPVMPPTIELTMLMTMLATKALPKLEISNPTLNNPFAIQDAT